MAIKTTTHRHPSPVSGLLDTIGFGEHSSFSDHQRLNLLSLDQHLQSALSNMRRESNAANIGKSTIKK